MTSLLRRLTIVKSGRDEGAGPVSGSRPLTSSTSFSDFSLGTHIDADDTHAPAPVETAFVDPCPPSPSILASSAPTTGYGFSGLAKSAALRIPRPSMAHILEQRLFANGNGGAGGSGTGGREERAAAQLCCPAEASTPRSSMDIGSAPAAAGPPMSPRAPPTPMSPARPFPATHPGVDPSEPASPRSPRTPGGRRRKSGKIDGVDYYDYCELIRTSSL